MLLYSHAAVCHYYSVPGTELNQRIYSDPESLHLLHLIGTGAYGQVHKAAWRGTVVAAKTIMLAGNTKIIDNELNVYR
jgi:hypothetical protein